MFEKILIANRGEIALRVLRACRELGIHTVAVHSTADADAMHVRLADESVCIGPPAAKDSYLNIPSIVCGLRNHRRGSGASRLRFSLGKRPLRRNPDRARHQVHWPLGREHPHHGRQDRGQAHRQRHWAFRLCRAQKVALPTVDEARKVASDIGYPVIIKATAGGGGRGMKVARNESDLEVAVVTAQTEAKAAFGNGEVYIEKYLEKPRHIEIQVLGDGKGNAVHLGERDCSLQRRHQKVWEEAHSPALNAKQRDEIGGRVARAMAQLGYEGVGTIEFLYENNEFYFIEMNTRLQVEHPVTEMITGLDLVQEQIRVASGARLP